MTFSIYAASVPVFTRMLTNLLGLLNKAEEYAAERKFDVNVLVDARLAPDMLPLRAQIGIATDHAKGATARLASKDVPSWPDDEKTFADLKARVQKALDFLATANEADYAAAEDRDLVLRGRTGDQTLKGQNYLLERALPNFYFHVTTAYDILRHTGVPIGKSDFLGS